MQGTQRDMGAGPEHKMNIISLYLVIFFSALISSYAATFLVKKMALKKRYFDKPSKRKIHTRKIPTLGGIAIWAGFNIGMALAFCLVPGLYYDFFIRFAGFSISAFIIVFMGIYDDLHNLNANIKLIIQILAAVILIAVGFEIKIITRPLGGSLPLGALGFFVSVLWVVGMVNAINLLDGLDGLAAGVTGIAAFFLFIAAFQMNALPVAFLSICLVGTVLGFLPHNFYPAKIFMGNAGSMFLGLVLSVIALAGFQKRTAIFTLFVPLMAVAVPILDTFLSVVRRVLKRKPVFKADKEHIHHKLLVEEKSQLRVVLSLYFLTICFGLIALSFSRLQGVYGLLALIIVALVTFKWLKSWGFLEFK